MAFRNKFKPKKKDKPLQTTQSRPDEESDGHTLMETGTKAKVKVSQTVDYEESLVRDAKTNLREITVKFQKNVSALVASCDSERLVAQSLTAYANVLRNYNGIDENLIKQLKNMSLCLQTIAEHRKRMTDSIKSLAIVPMEEFVKVSIGEAEASRVTLEKARKNYESAENKLRHEKEKTKVNVQRVVECERERDTAKTLFEDQMTATTNILKTTNAKNHSETAIELSDLFDAYNKFFKRVHSELEKREGLVTNIRANAVEERVGIVDRVRISPSKLEFLDIDEARWEKETDPQKSLFLRFVAEEEMYVKLLRSLRCNYRDPLLNDEPYVSKVPEQDVTAIFGGIEDLYHLHASFLEQLEGMVEYYPNVAFGEVSLAVVDEMSQYSTYAVNMSIRKDAIGRLEKYVKEVKKFLALSKTKDNACLARILDLPLRRVHYYAVMLPRFEGPSAALKEAIGILRTIESDITANTEISDELIPVVNVRNKLCDYDGANLVNRNRRLMKEGVLNHVLADGKKDEYYCFLFNDIFLYCKKLNVFQKQKAVTRQVGEGEIISSGKYKYLGEYTLLDSRPTSLADTDVVKNAFELTQPSGRLTLMSSSVEERDEWVEKLKKTCDGMIGSRIYGLGLDELIALPTELGNKVPSLLIQLVNALDAGNAHLEEGIFRLSGAKRDIEAYQRRIDGGEEFVYPESVDPHVLAGLLKQWLRMLPDPLIPFAFYDQFAEVSVDAEDNERIAGYTAAIAALPKVNRSCLGYIIHYAAKVATHSDTNLMNARNLSLVFGPNMMYRDGDDIFQVDYRDAYAVVGFFINHAVPLFGPSETLTVSFRRKSSTVSGDASRPLLPTRAIGRGMLSASVGGPTEDAIVQRRGPARRAPSRTLRRPLGSTPRQPPPSTMRVDSSQLNAALSVGDGKPPGPPTRRGSVRMNLPPQPPPPQVPPPLPPSPDEAERGVLE